MKKPLALLALLLTALLACLLTAVHGAPGLITGLVCYAVVDSIAARHVVDLQGGRLCNTFGTLAASGILYDVLGLTLKRLPFIRAMAKDVRETYGDINMPFNVAQVLKNFNTDGTVDNFTSTGSYFAQANQALTLPADGSITLNQWPFLTIRLTPTEVNQMVDTATNSDARALSVRKLWDRGFNKFAQRMVADFYGVITATNFPTVSGANPYVTAAGTMDYKQLGAVTDALLLQDALNPATDPNAILSIPAYRELSNSLTTIANSTWSVSDVVGGAEIMGQVGGCQSAARYNVALPTDAARGMVFDPQAIVMVNRVPREETLANDPVFLEVMVDPDTGFQLLYREAKDVASGEVHRTITTMYGFAPGLTNHLIRLTAS